MKKYLFLASVAALSFTACTNETEEFTGTGSASQQKEIALFALNQKVTRAAGTAEYNAVEAVDYPQNYNMKVVSYIVPETGGTPGNYFGSATADGGILFKYNYAGGTSGGTNNYWGGEPAQYWPLSPATLNFLAVSKGGSPTADVVSPQFNANYASGVTVTLSDNKPQTAATGDGQQDLMYAFGRAVVTKSTNVLTIPTKVDMQFNHALSWVYFRVKAGNSASTAISIKSIKLNGAKYGGTFTAAVDNYDKADGSGDLAWNAANTKWTAANAQANNILSPNVIYDTDADDDGDEDSKALTAAFAGFGDGILVVPTSDLTSTTSMTSFTIEYYLNGVLQTPFEYTPATDAEKTFSKGKKYIFDITMSLSEIFVNPSVVDWDETGNVGEFVDIPAYTIGSNWNYGTISKAASTYKFSVVGTGTLSITASTGFDSAPTISTGVVSFAVSKNTGAEKTYTITITDDMGTVGNTSDDKTSVITIKQAAGA